ncbi:retrovirus-related pol polyprotein from transposon TNT 1-94 [Tanacetum coccineum]
MTDADKTAALKTDVYKKAHSALLLCLDNKVLREVNKENSAAGGVEKEGQMQWMMVIGSLEKRLSKKEEEGINWFCSRRMWDKVLVLRLTWRDFLFDFKEFNGGTVLLEKESLAQVWHKRLGHISEAGLHELEKREVLGNKGLGSFSGGIDEWLPVLLIDCRKLKKLRTDNGLEFCNQEFNDLCKESGPSRHLTLQESLQNGLAEQMNRTLLNKVMCLLIQSGFPDSFWAEATVTAAYLINRSPSTALEKKTPMDLWSGHPANYEMLRIFGCVAYLHMNQGKLKPRAIKCIFLGYLVGVKGYRLWKLDDVKPKIIISRDVVFNESLMYKDTFKGAGAADSGKEVSLRWNQGEDEGPQQELDNMFLVRDRATRTNTILQGIGQCKVMYSLSRPSGSKVDDDGGYAFVYFSIDEEEDKHKLITFMRRLIHLKKWLYKIKEGIEGVQKPRVILSLTACEDYELEQLDVKTAFLHGSLMYLMVYTRPDIAYAVSIVSKYLANPGLVYGRDQWKHVDVDGFVDADYAKDLDKEAEYMALTEAVKESIWLKGLLIELGVNLRSVVVNSDNKSAIHLSRNATFLDRMKHINVRYHFIREIMESKEIEVAKIGKKDNATDAFTKVVPGPKFKYCMKILGVGIN